MALGLYLEKPTKDPPAISKSKFLYVEAVSMYDAGEKCSLQFKVLLQALKGIKQFLCPFTY